MLFKMYDESRVQPENLDTAKVSLLFPIELLRSVISETVGVFFSNLTNALQLI